MGNDFCMVQLTQAGAARASGNPMRISNGRTSLIFLPGVPLKVARYEWDHLLAHYHTACGGIFFELVPAGTGNVSEETHP